MKRKLTAMTILVTALAGTTGPSTAGSDLTTASQLSTEGLITIGAGAFDALSGVTELTVVAVEASVDGSGLILKGASEAGAFLVDAGGLVVGGASLTVGQVVAVTASATGYLLIAGGEVVAFLPNAIGRSLIHHRQRS